MDESVSSLEVLGEGVVYEAVTINVALDPLTEKRKNA